MTVVDAKEFFEYTPGVLRAHVRPTHLGALTFNLQPVLERRDGSASSGPNRRSNVSPNNKVSVMEVPGMEETQECDRILCAAGHQL